MTRDFTKPLSVSDLEKITDSFRSMPSFEADSISVGELAQYFKKIDWDRTPEQIAVYSSYYENNFGGRIPFQILQEGMAIVQDPAELMLIGARVFDINGDGLVSKEDFSVLEKTMITHEPKLKDADYVQLMTDADVSHGGKVSLAEFAALIRTTLKTN